eukprot:TRINITY_DN165_c0_g1_i1.p1 TRINITY_DN165_c0_g1~~TRINITY_DN165_c0_g1_i1.p1  ORF type:complete len:265 (-),score=28.84 TRINITY_DN165_c0_g1_i1:54-848(-)
MSRPVWTPQYPLPVRSQKASRLPYGVPLRYVVPKPKHRVLLLGVGNHIYPRSRWSAGYYVLLNFVKKLGMQFRRSKGMRGYIAENQKFVVVNPATYLIRDNPDCLVTALSLAPTSSTYVVSYNEEVLIGSLEMIGKSRYANHPALRDVTEVFEDIPQLAVGVSYGPGHNRNSRYIDLLDNPHVYYSMYQCNKLPDDDLEILETVVTDKLIETANALWDFAQERQGRSVFETGPVYNTDSTEFKEAYLNVQSESFIHPTPIKKQS